MKAKEIIAAFGGPTKMARAVTDDCVKVAPSTVHSWGVRESIPPCRHKAILDAAAELNLPLTKADLTG